MLLVRPTVTRIRPEDQIVKRAQLVKFLQLDHLPARSAPLARTQILKEFASHAPRVSMLTQELLLALTVLRVSILGQVLEFVPIAQVVGTKIQPGTHLAPYVWPESIQEWDRYHALYVLLAGTNHTRSDQNV